MSYHPRVETKELASFQTTRTSCSKLWFVNNKRLEDSILGYAAKYSARYEVKLYALAIEGNHIQSPAFFPKGNRASFMRDFNSNVARSVPRFVPEYDGGKLWARRYSSEFLPGDQDVEEYFFYTVLQPVKDGLVPTIDEYPEYNCFYDAIYDVGREFKVVQWKEYNDARRYNPQVSIEDFSEKVVLRYTRLPGYEDLSQQEYAKLMLDKLRAREQAIVADRRAKGLGFLGAKQLRRVRRGARPKNTKTSHRYSHRPRVLSVCPKRRAECLAWYFDIYFDFKEASRQYRAGRLNVKFPPGTYRPFIPDSIPIVANYSK